MKTATKVDLESSECFNAEMAHTFRGMVAGFNIASGTSLVSVVGTRDFAIETQDGLEIARIQREDVTSREALDRWMRDVLFAEVARPNPPRLGGDPQEPPATP